MENYLRLIQFASKSLKIKDYEINNTGADNLIIITNNRPPTKLVLSINQVNKINNKYC